MEGKGKSDERGKIPNFESIELIDLNSKILEASAKGKFIYIADMSGKAATYFNYQAQLLNFSAESLKVIVQKSQTHKEAGEVLRKNVVSAMRSGRTLVINLDTMVPPLKSKYDCAELPLTKLIFNRDNLFEDYMKVVKEEENYDIV
mmetsp:Transcript_12949/g.21910  ORF Transcript_12949/g.21910 Transcript_12949/m.21910 type:complete len:146 (-) Transcript_12949:207-644(-)